MKIFRNKYEGSVSIYFVFSVVLIISVVMSITEMARINCQKLYLQIATDSGLDSMVSLYHRDLYNFYNLYGVEYETKDLLETEYLSYMEPYFTDGDGYLNNWYIAEIDEENIDLNFNELVNEYNLEKEITEYMQNKLIGRIVSFLGQDFEIVDEDVIGNLADRAKEIFEKTEESSIYSEVHKKYFDFADDIRILENYAKTIMDKVDVVNNKINNIRTMSTGGSLSNAKTVATKMTALQIEISVLNNALLNYRTKMDEFRGKVNESKDNYLTDKNLNTYKFSNDVENFIESEFEMFISFVDENSDMNKAIEDGFNNSEIISDKVSTDKVEINNYIGELQSIEDTLEYERSQRGEDRDNDYIAELVEERKDVQDSLTECLKEMRETYRNCKMERIDLEISGTRHPEEENLLNKLIGFVNGGILGMVIDADEIGKLNVEDILINDFNILSNVDAVSKEKVLIGEYELDKFNYYNKDLNKEITRSESKDLEVERLICGYDSDFKNMKAIVDKILVIRIAFDVMYIYTNAEKRESVRRFTMALFSGFSPLLAEAMFLVVLTAWGTAQALADVKKILKNKRVALFHSDETWTVSIEEMLNIAKNGLAEGNSDDDNGIALNYKDYLRLILLCTKQDVINNRMAGIIENNVKKKQSGFDFEKLIYSFDTNNTFACKHFFTNFIFLKAKDIELFDRYRIETSAYKSFYD